MSINSMSYHTTIDVELSAGSVAYDVNLVSVEITYSVPNQAGGVDLITVVYNPTSAVIVQPTTVEAGSIKISEIPIFDGSNAVKVKYYNNVDFNLATEVKVLVQTGCFVRGYDG